MRSGVARAALLGFVLAAAAHARLCDAEPREVACTVVWIHQGRVYLAGRDSGALAHGERLTFLDRGKRIAAGEVERVHDGVLAMARVTTGSLERVRKPGRLRVLAEPRRFDPLPLLRVGYPGPRRSSLLFRCPEVAWTSPQAGPAERLPDGVYRLVRVPGGPPEVPWPETLLVRPFDEVADEEIALERAELDVAVFWPGEPSAHLREEGRWLGHPFGIRERGVLAAAWAGEVATRDSGAASLPGAARLAGFNQRLFRGDLWPWPPTPAVAAPSGPADASRQPVRYVVDPSLPGQRTLERHLNPGPAPPDVPIVRILYLDAPLAAADSVARAAGAAPLFAVRCPVVCATALAPYVRALGADALVNLLDCDGAGSRR